MGLALQERMRAGFLMLAKSPRFQVIDGTRAQDEIAKVIETLALSHLG
jgi:thymidylate kinase